MPGATAPGPVRPNCSATCDATGSPRFVGTAAGTAAERTQNARQVALDVLRRIEDDGAYANLALGPALQQSGLGELDRKFVTELVYGTTRMRRACDALVDRFLTSPPDAVDPVGAAARRLPAGLRRSASARRGRRDRRARPEAHTRPGQRRAAQGVTAVGRGDGVAVRRCAAELSRLDRRHVPRRARRRVARRPWRG